MVIDKWACFFLPQFNVHYSILQQASIPSMYSYWLFRNVISRLWNNTIQAIKTLSYLDWKAFFSYIYLYHRIVSFYSDGVIMSRKLNQSYHEEKIIFQIDSNSTIKDKYSTYWGVVRRYRYNIKKYTLEIRNSKNQSILFKLKDRQSLALLTDKIKVMMCNMRIDMISKKNELRNELLMEAAGQSSSEQEKDDSQYSASQLQRDYRYNQSTKQSYNISPTLLKAKKMKAEARRRCL